MKAQCRHQLNSTFNELCKYCLHLWGFAVNFWRTTYNLGNILGCSKIPIGWIWPKTGLAVTQSQYRKFIWGQEKASWNSYLPHYLEIPFRSPSYMYTLEEASTVVSFYTTSQMVLNFSCFSLCFLPHLPLPCPSPFDAPFSGPPIYTYLFCFLFLTRFIYSSYSLINTVVLWIVDWLSLT